jgi:hypothetical protein
VGCRNVSHIHVVIHEYRTSYRTHQNAAILYAQIVDGFGDEFVQDAVPATGAVVGYFGVAAFAFISVIKRW